MNPDAKPEPDWHPDSETPLAPDDDRNRTLSEVLDEITRKYAPLYPADVWLLYLPNVDCTFVAKDLERMGIAGCTVYGYDLGTVIETDTRALHLKLKTVYQDARENPYGN